MFWTHNVDVFRVSGSRWFKHLVDLWNKRRTSFLYSNCIVTYLSLSFKTTASRGGFILLQKIIERHSTDPPPWWRRLHLHCHTLHLQVDQRYVSPGRPTPLLRHATPTASPWGARSVTPTQSPVVRRAATPVTTPGQLPVYGQLPVAWRSSIPAPSKGSSIVPAPMVLLMDLQLGHPLQGAGM